MEDLLVEPVAAVLTLEAWLARDANAKIVRETAGGAVQVRAVSRWQRRAPRPRDTDSAKW
jgi:hypothetical protein